MESETYNYPIAKSLELISNDCLTVKKRDGKLPYVELDNNRPLVVLFMWLQAQPRYERKYIEIYLNKGFDVLKVSTNKWQLMWPTIGCKVSASNVLDFLHEHEHFQPLFVHGLSCGTYVWTEVMVKAKENMEKYGPTLQRVKGQVYDSPPSPPPQFQKGFAIALFPNNSFLSMLFEYAITFQLFVFYNIVTKHLIKGYEVAHDPPIKIPSLMFISKDDPISPFDRSFSIVESWKKNGLKAFIKWWEHSPHVGHYKSHPDDYLELIDTVMDSAGLNDIIAPKRIKPKVTTLDA